MVFLFFNMCFALPSTAVTLEEITQLALDNDAQLKADQFLAESKHAEGLSALGEYGTNLYLSGSYMQSSDSSDPESSAELEKRSVNFNESDFTVSLEQPLIDLEKLNTAREGFVIMDMAELLHKQAKEDLLLKVNERFYALLSSIENHNLAKAESEALKEQLENAQERLELGFGTITDQNNAEARHSTALANEISRKIEVENAQRALEELINQDLLAPIEDSELNKDLLKLPKSENEWHEIAKTNNTSLNLRRLEERAAFLKKNSAQSRFLPDLVMFADYNERNPSDSLIGYGERRTEADVGIKLQMELLSGGRDAASAVAASKRAKAAREQKHVSERDLTRQVGSLWTSIQNTYRLIGAYEKAVVANQSAFESTQASYDEGVKVLLDVLNAQQDYFRSQREYRTSRYEYMILLAKLEKVVGTGIDVEIE